MLTTAKSIQLLDVSGMNISPITDITSLYYEVQNPSDNKIISRKYIYDGFPVFVNISDEEIPQIGVASISEERHPNDGSLYNNGQFYKLINKTSNSDILVSNIDTDIVPGTTLRQLNITNYNLSEILSYYTPLDLMDASYGELIVDIIIINASIIDISNRMHIIRESLDTSICSFDNIKYWIDNESLVPNKFYLINDYYVGGDGCMALPNNNNFSGPDSNSSLSLLVKANDVSALDGKLYEMYDHSENALKVYGTYKLEDNNTKVHITYMKDQYGNEAPYDFYNLKYNGKYTFGTSSINSNIQNNIIKTDPYTFNSMPVFEPSDGSTINNYIGYDNVIQIKGKDRKNIMVHNNNNIAFDVSDYEISNIQIYNNNTIILNCTSPTGYYKNININSFNNITGISSQQLNNLNIDSSNNITISNSASNVTILNNCDGSINLSDNIIVDNYINIAANSSLNTSSNSVYLFKQDVYAKSFNTLK